MTPTTRLSCVLSLGFLASTAWSQTPSWPGRADRPEPPFSSSVPSYLGPGITADLPPPLQPGPSLIAFRETWAYLVSGEESSYDKSLGITDLAYFGASLNSQGELSGLPNLARLKGFTGRKHLVLAVQDNFALAHMALYPGFPVRGDLLNALVAAAVGYEGVQLDFESVTTKDKEFFWSFLADLKARLPDKMISIAVPARTSAVADAYDYRVIAPLVDRVIIMAYDEHWSGSAPGSVASLEWCRKVAAFAQKTFDPVKLVMGAPFYGRAWADRSLSRAYKFSGVTKILGDKGLPEPQRTDGIPNFEYDEQVRVRVFYEDRLSQATRLGQYAAMGVKNIAFWRLGQEDPTIWSVLKGEG